MNLCSFESIDYFADFPTTSLNTRKVKVKVILIITILLRVEFDVCQQRRGKDQKQTQFEFSDLILGVRHCCSWRQFCAGSAALNGRQGEAAALLTCVTKVVTCICVNKVTVATGTSLLSLCVTMHMCHHHHGSCNDGLFVSPPSFSSQQAFVSLMSLQLVAMSTRVTKVTI